MQRREALQSRAAWRRRDSEAALRRLQGELQHAVDLERSRTAEAAAAAEAAAEKAAAARQEGEAARFALRSWQEAESASAQQQVRRGLPVLLRSDIVVMLL